MGLAAVIAMMIIALGLSIFGAYREVGWRGIFLEWPSMAAAAAIPIVGIFPVIAAIIAFNNRDMPKPKHWAGAFLPAMIWALLHPDPIDPALIDEHVHGREALDAAFVCLIAVFCGRFASKYHEFQSIE